MNFMPLQILEKMKLYLVKMVSMQQTQSLQVRGHLRIPNQKEDKKITNQSILERQ